MFDWKALLGKRLWLGLILGMLGLFLIVMLGAWLCTAEVLPTDCGNLVAYIAWGFATMLGVGIAVADRKKPAIKAVIIASLYCVIVLLVGDLVFERQGWGEATIGVFVAVWIGGLLSMLFGTRSKKKNHKVRSRRK